MCGRAGRVAAVSGLLHLTYSGSSAARRGVGRRRPKRSEDAARPPPASGPTADSNGLHARAVGWGGVLAALPSPPPRPTALAWRRHYESGATNTKERASGRRSGSRQTSVACPGGRLGTSAPPT